jgi:biopolymer transport protein TolQ
MLSPAAALILASGDLSIVNLVLTADPVVKFVMLVLVGFSVFSWAIIIQRYRMITAATRQSADFVEFFWTTASLDDANKAVGRYPDSPIANTFAAGYRELLRLGEVETNTGSGPRGGGTDNVGRALRRASSQALSRLEKNISFLASCGSAAPFIGLFGTVWGILRAFQQIGVSGSTSIAEIGPHIAEALIATAVGLFAAIPAVMFFNFFATRLKVLATEISNFNYDFLNLVERHERSRMGRK